jgi:large subunit ribosomal protein L25
MEKIELQAQARTADNPSKLRKQGLIPAVIYGHKVNTEVLTVPYAEFEKVFRKAGESSIITLNVDGQPKNVLIQDVQKHYLNGRFQHVDFYAVSMTEKLRATVPLEFVGVSKAVKENSGILLELIKEVEVECLPGDLPQSIEVDITSLLTFEDAILVKDLKVSDKVAVMSDADSVVVKADPPRDVEKELSESLVGDVSQVEGVADKEPVAEEKKADEKKKE